MWPFSKKSIKMPVTLQRIFTFLHIFWIMSSKKKNIIFFIIFIILHYNSKFAWFLLYIVEGNCWQNSMIWIQSFEKLMGFEQQCDKQYTFSFLKTNNKSLNQNYHNFNDFLECKVGYNYFSPTVSKMKLKDKETINYTHQIKKLIWVALSNSLKKYTMLSHLRDKNEKMSIFCKKWAFEGIIINFHNLHNSNVIIQSLLAFS